MMERDCRSCRHLMKTHPYYGGSMFALSAPPECDHPNYNLLPRHAVVRLIPGGNIHGCHLWESMDTSHERPQTYTHIWAQPIHKGDPIMNRSPHGGIIWSQESPDEPGFYWVCHESGRVSVIEVERSPIGGLNCEWQDDPVKYWGAAMVPPQSPAL